MANSWLQTMVEYGSNINSRRTLTVCETSEIAFVAICVRSIYKMPELTSDYITYGFPGVIIMLEST